MFSSMKKLSTIFALLLCLGEETIASPMINFDMTPSNGADVEFNGTSFGTVNDGIAGTIGAQNTNMNFIGFLAASITDTLTGASLTFQGVDAFGAPVLSSGGIVVAQNTQGGHFSFWDENNELLLEGQLGAGVIVGAQGSTTGSFFNTEIGTFLGGSLLQYVSAQPAGLSLALGAIFSNGQNGLSLLFDSEGLALSLNPFTADAAGVIDGVAAVPEPITAALLVSGLLVGAGARRRNLKGITESKIINNI